MRQMTIASLAAILAAGLIAVPAQGAASRSDARAYGKLCQNKSKKRASGSTGTPFSRCVTALGRLARAQTRSPRIACQFVRECQVVMAVGETRINSQGFLVGTNRLFEAIDAFQQDSEVEQNQRIGTAMPEPFPVGSLSFTHLPGFMQEPAQIGASAGMSGV